ncbi:MAG: DUF2303 family protein [Hyphomicrobiales bacterium]|nr:DUF2303 family protein [Hyphomicrobiales bacterium]
MNFETETAPAAPNIERIVELAVAGMGALDHPAGGQFVVVPDGYRVEHLKPVDAPLPGYVAQGVRVDMQSSLIEYVKAFMDEDTRIFADVRTNKITAVVDYHSNGGSGETAGPNVPGRTAHRAVYDLPHSEEWKRWTGVDGRRIPQVEFAEFIEENLIDIIEPEGAAVLEAAKTLQAARSVSFRSALNLSNGNVQFTYSEEDDAKTGKQLLTVPQKIRIAIPVYYGDPRTEIDALFRYRIEEGKLFFTLKMQRRAQILQEAFERKAAAIANDTGAPVIYGAI